MPLSSACISTVDWRVSMRLTTNAGASSHEHAALAELPRDVPRGRERRVVGRRRPHDLDERQHGDRVEEVQADDALGVREARRHRGDRERRRVRHEQALGRDDLLERAEHLLLDGELLEHRLEDEVAARVGVGARRPRSRATPRKRALPSLSRPFATSPASSPRIDSAALSARPGSTSVSTTGTSSRRRKSVASCVAIRPAPTTPTAWILRGCASGTPAALLDAPLDDVERVDRGLRLGPGQQLGERVLLRARSPPRGPRRRRPRSGRARGTARAPAPCTTSSTRARALRTTSATSERSAVGSRLPSPASIRRSEELDRLVEELDRLEDVVDEPELERLRGADQPVLLERVVDDQPHGVLGADEPRRQLRPAPGRGRGRGRPRGSRGGGRSRRPCGRRSGARSRARRRARRR